MSHSVYRARGPLRRLIRALSLAGLAACAVSAPELPPPSEPVLQAVDPQPAGFNVLHGRVIDEQGSIVLAGWAVHADLASASPSDSRAKHLQAQDDDTGDGMFRWSSIQPGAWRLLVFSRHGRSFTAWAVGPTVVVQEGEATSVDVVFTGGKPSDVLALHFDVQGRITLDPDPSDVWLYGPLPSGVQAQDMRDDGELSPEAAALTGLARVPGQPMPQPDPDDLHALASGELVLRGATSGPHVGVLRAPGYEKWRCDNLWPGTEPVDVRTRGTCALDLQVREAESGRPLTQFAVSGSVTRPAFPGDPRAPGRSGDLLSLAIHAEGRVILEDLVPGDWTLEVSAPGFQSAEAAAVTLAGDGERRVATVALARTATVAGTVTDTEGRPLTGVNVGAFAPAAEDSPDILFHTHEVSWSIAQPGPWFRSEKCAAKTDSEGRFMLPELAKGTWIVRAWRSSSLDAVIEGVVVGDGERTDGLDLVLPAGTWIEASLAIPPGASCGPLNVQAWPMRDGTVRAFPDTTLVDADGRFRIGPLGPGKVAVWLKMEDEWMPAMIPISPGQFDPQPLLATTLTIDPIAGVEDVTRSETLDLGDAYPARVHVSARLNGAPAAGAWAQLLDATTGAHLATRVLDEKGEATLGRFFACAARLCLSGADGSWFAYPEATVTPPPGGAAELVAEADIVAGRVRLLDPEGQALAREVVCVYVRTPFGWITRVLHTDDDGGVEFQLAPTELAVLHVGTKGEVLLPKPGVFSSSYMGEPLFPPEPDATLPRVAWSTRGPEPAVATLERAADG